MIKIEDGNIYKLRSGVVVRIEPFDGNPQLCWKIAMNSVRSGWSEYIAGNKYLAYREPLDSMYQAVKQIKE